MGDTGSMALGGLLGTVAVLGKQEFLFLIVGGVFVGEAFSVLVQQKIGIKWLGRREFSFWAWFFLGIVTCGLYYLYSEYKMALAIQEIQEKLGIRVNSSLATVSIIVSLIASPMVSSAIQQYEINQLKLSPVYSEPYDTGTTVSAGSGDCSGGSGRGRLQAGYSQSDSVLIPDPARVGLSGVWYAPCMPGLCAR